MYLSLLLFQSKIQPGVHLFQYAAFLHDYKYLQEVNYLRDFITAVDEKNIILVKELKSNETYEDLGKTAKILLDMLNTEAMTQVHIAFVFQYAAFLHDYKYLQEVNYLRANF